MVGPGLRSPGRARCAASSVNSPQPESPTVSSDPTPATPIDPASAAPIGAATARFIAQPHAWSAGVLDMAKRCLADWMGCALGAYHQPATGVFRRTVAGWGARGDARILLGDTTAPALAALVNGTMAHTLDYDDTRADAASHLSGPTWGAAFAVASHLGAGAAETLAAFATGFEVGAVLGGTAFEEKLLFRGFHTTSVFGRFSGAAAAAVLMGLSEAQTAQALGFCATNAAGLNASFGTMNKPSHAGKAAMDGILAAQLAAEGFQATTNLLDADNGLAGTFVQDRSARIKRADFTEGHSLLTNTFKPYACGKLIHGHIDAARSLRERIAGRPVERIHLLVSPLGGKHVGRGDPRTPLEAKFSIAYGVALALLGYAARPRDFSEERLADPAVRDLMGRVSLEVRPEVGLWGSVMDVTLADGETLHAEVAESWGNPGNPLTWADLNDKFTDLVEPVLGPRTQSLFDAIRGFESPGAFARVLELVSGAPVG